VAFHRLIHIHCVQATTMIGGWTRVACCVLREGQNLKFEI
jgi:hypothetical protein